MDQRRRHERLQTVAEQQWQVVTIAQLREAGFTDTVVQGLLAEGTLHRRHPGIYAYGMQRIPWRGVLLAAQWSLGKDAFLTGRTALALDSIGRAYLQRIEVAVPRRTVRKRQAPIVLTRVAGPPPSLHRDGPLRWVPPTEAIFHVARRGERIDALLTKAIHLERFDHARMRELLDAAGRCPGIVAARAAYRQYLPDPLRKSGLELAFDQGLATRPWMPIPERNVQLTVGGITWEIDRLWPEQRLALELDGGGYHDAKADREKDSYKAAKLSLIGIETLRVSDTRYELEPDACLDDLEQLLQRRGWRRSD